MRRTENQVADALATRMTNPSFTVFQVALPPQVSILYEKEKARMTDPMNRAPRAYPVRRGRDPNFYHFL